MDAKAASSAPAPARTRSDDYPLPPEWKRAVHAGKPYFVNSTTKETSWIDPRDKLWKKMTWEECGADEIPYGWEVKDDPRVGRFFVDHVNRRNLLDDPRSKVPQQQMQAVKQAIVETTRQIDSKMKTLRLKKDAVAKMKQQFAAEEQQANSSTPAATPAATSTAPAAAITPVAEEKEKLDEMQQEVARLESEINNNEQHVSMMAAVVTNLESGVSDQLQRQKEVQEEIEQLQAKLAAQAQIRSQIQDQLASMQKVYTSTAAPNKQNLRVLMQQADTVLQLNPNSAAAPQQPVVIPSQAQLKPTTAQAPKSPVGNKVEPATASVATTNTHATANPDAAFGVGLSHVTPMTRIEREMELLALKKQIQLESTETERLYDIAAKARLEVEQALKVLENPGTAQASGDGKTPKWIKALNENASKSATIRVKAKQRAQEAVETGQVMSFADKLLFFTAEQQQVNLALSTPKRK